ncbi:MAG: hypothetical protein WCT39_06400, partial [Candidatus Margulisiibacteriota bacterium]
MKKILLLSNGHAEDLVAEQIAHQLASSCETIRIPLVDTTLPSGGFSLRNFNFLWHDIGAGLIGSTIKHWKTLKELRGKVDLTVAIGDIVPIIGALLVGAPFIFVGVNKSSYYKTFGYNYTPWEKFLLKKYALKTFVRDRETLKSLPFAEYVGNPLLGEMSNDQCSRCAGSNEGKTIVGLLPGTRNDALLNMEDFERVITELVNQRDESDPKLDFITATTLTNLPEYIENKQFEQVLAESNLIIGLSGTGNEQAAGCGIPVVSFPGRGSQYNRKFAKAQKELLGNALMLVDSNDHATIAAKVWQLLKNNQLRKQMEKTGKERMGDPGAIDKISVFINKEQLYIKNFKNILIIRPDAIGDLVLTLPAIHAIRKHFPAAKITVLAREYTRPILENHPDIDKIIYDYDFKKYKFDLSVNFYNEFKDTFATFRAHIPYRLGDSSRILTSWMNNLRVFRHFENPNRHEIDFNFDLLAPLGIKEKPEKPHILVDPDALAQIKILLNKNGIIPGDLLA